MNAEIKLLATEKKNGTDVYAMVTPKMIRDNNPLYSVRGVFNSILVKGNLLGDVMFYGSGAGKLPTASAVVADVVEAVKHKGANIPMIWSSKKLALSDRLDAESGFFVRVPEEEKENAKEIFGDVEEVCAGVAGEFAFLTKKMSERSFEEKAAKVTILNRIRTEWCAE